MNTFLFALNVILPLILLISLGYYLKKIRFFDLYFASNLNKYIFRVGLPVLLFFNVYAVDRFDVIDWSVVIFSVLSILGIFAIGLISVLLMIKDNEQKGVILQGIIRSNFALIGIPLASALGGTDALAIVAILSAFSIPITNILSVFALTYFHQDAAQDPISFKKLMQAIITNPLIIAVFLGVIVLLVRSFIPRVDGEPVFMIKNQFNFLYETLRLISLTATPMALIALGAQFEFQGNRASIKPIVIGVAWRVAIAPGIIMLIAYLLTPYFPGLGTSYHILIAMFAAPVAVATVVMTHELGGDEKLAAQLVFWSNVMSILTVFIFIVIFRSVGAI